MSRPPSPLSKHWHVACASVELGAEPAAARILGADLALFRDPAGRPRALLDRCCHRGFPLSKSAARDGRLACGFHGWEFDGAGRCVGIPSQLPGKSIPKSFRVPSYECQEKDGYVWARLAEPDSKAGRVPPPAIPELSLKDENWLQGARVIECNYLRALEITYDSAHIYFVHPNHPATLAARQHGFKESASEIRLTPTGCVVFSPPARAAGRPIPAESSTMEFILPNRIRFVARGPGRAYYMYWHATPMDDRRCRLHWLITNPRPDAPPLRWIDRGREIIEDDQATLELIQKAYDREGEAFERSVEADATMLTLRRIVRAAEAGTWDPASGKMAKRRIVRTMDHTGPLFRPVVPEKPAPLPP